MSSMLRPSARKSPIALIIIIIRILSYNPNETLMQNRNETALAGRPCESWLR